MNPDFVTVPPEVFTEIYPPPVDVPEATLAIICDGLPLLSVIIAAVPPVASEAVPNFIALIPVRFVPFIVIKLSDPADVGEKVVIVGLGKKVKPDFVAVPAEVTTFTLPLVPVFTTAVICELLFTV